MVYVLVVLCTIFPAFSTFHCKQFRIASRCHSCNLYSLLVNTEQRHCRGRHQWVESLGCFPSGRQKEGCGWSHVQLLLPDKWGVSDTFLLRLASQSPPAMHTLTRFAMQWVDSFYWYERRRQGVIVGRQWTTRLLGGPAHGRATGQARNQNAAIVCFLHRSHFIG